MIAPKNPTDASSLTPDGRSLVTQQIADSSQIDTLPPAAPNVRGQEVIVVAFYVIGGSAMIVWLFVLVSVLEWLRT